MQLGQQSPRVCKLSGAELQSLSYRHLLTSAPALTDHAPAVLMQEVSVLQGELCHQVSWGCEARSPVCPAE